LGEKREKRKRQAFADPFEVLEIVGKGAERFRPIPGGNGGDINLGKSRSLKQREKRDPELGERC